MSLQSTMSSPQPGGPSIPCLACPLPMHLSAARFSFQQIPRCKCKPYWSRSYTTYKNARI